MSAFEEGYRLDPVSAVVVNDLGYGYLWAGRFEEAAARCAEAARLEPRARVGLECGFAADGARPQGLALGHARLIVGNTGDDPARSSERTPARWGWPVSGDGRSTG
ncbi:MAG: hypothetical protein R2909_16025 [Gemmatimonadales bacterium]